MRSSKKRNLKKFLENPNNGVKESYDFPVDAVISWVDVNDPEWRKSKELYSSENEGSEDHLRFNSASCNDCELYICVQLILRNIPWIRTIFIACTRPQKPAFFEYPEIQKLVKAGKLKLVYHDQFFSEKGDLPTFNSCAIEANIQNISPFVVPRSLLSASCSALSAFSAICPPLRTRSCFHCCLTCYASYFFP